MINKNMEVIVETIKAFASEITGYPNDEIEMDDHYGSSGLDSLDFVELIMDCEKEYNICLSDEACSNCKSLNDLAKLIKAETEK